MSEFVSGFDVVLYVISVAFEDCVEIRFGCIVFCSVIIVLPQLNELTRVQVFGNFFRNGIAGNQNERERCAKRRAEIMEKFFRKVFFHHKIMITFFVNNFK